MRRWSAIFLVFANVAAIVGFIGIVAGAASITKSIFLVFKALVLIIGILGYTLFKKNSHLLLVLNVVRIFHHPIKTMIEKIDKHLAAIDKNRFNQIPE